MHYALCCIGHITLDKVITPAAAVHMPGGTAYYFSHAVQGIRLPYLLVTAVADAELPSVELLKRRGVEVKRLPSKHTVFFENRYYDNGRERTQRVLQQADAFRLEDLNGVNASIFHLGPLLAADVSEDIIKALAAKAKVSLDVQGLLRKVEGEKVAAVDWHAKKEALPFVHFLKASEDEVKVLTGLDDVHESAEQLVQWGVKEAIVTLGGKGSVIYDGQRFFYIPAYQPAAITDATGCGDTYMAGYLSQRERGAGIQQAGEFAAAVASLKLASSGPFAGSEEDVKIFLQSATKGEASLY